MSSPDKIWWYARDDTRYGPCTSEELKALAAAGRIVGSDMVWKEGLADWMEASAVKGLLSPAGVGMPPPLPGKAIEPAPAAATGTEPAGNPRKRGVLAKVALWAGGLIVGLVVLGALVGPDNKNESSSSSAPSSSGDEGGAISNISWSEVDGVYALESHYTELQKKETWKQYKGKRVRWLGRVSSVGEMFGTVTLQVKMNPDTWIAEILIDLEDSERSKALQLREGQFVTFSGVLDDWGTVMPITLKHGRIQ